MVDNIWITKKYKLGGVYYGGICFYHSSNICTYFGCDWVIFLFAEMMKQCVVSGANRNHSAYINCTGSER